ncbi:DNA-binding MarR family transcriptional regulator [Motilibacter rhizosphaerae]|uniref:DNA-binding MarR family transcriptional regulator n=1 Tax=Motilibacter rhizosphaerae TaxID=598652 RepID=A0A4Q7N7G1_9ACTN|nr:MarR family transcriptional regulator [Motilibacter rhizosphaerae]RZS77907.1 DNA-binding MarR family transcriptional regulator [Motilibacter rhizosphaerae]
MLAALPRDTPAAEPIVADNGLELGYLALLAANSVRAGVDQAADELGLLPLDVHALYVLAVHGTLPSGTLAALLGVQPAAVTGLAHRLEEAGLLRRQRDEHDRRRTWLDLTPAASPVLAHAVEIVRPLMSEAFGRLGRGTAVALANLLGAVLDPWILDHLPTTRPGTGLREHREDREL